MFKLPMFRTDTICQDIVCFDSCDKSWTVLIFNLAFDKVISDAALEYAWVNVRTYTVWQVFPATNQISLRSHAVWSVFSMDIFSL